MAAVSAALQHQIEQFYYHEAALLDSRQYRQWLQLCDQAIRYTMPARVNVQVDNRMRGQEDMISLERELEGADSHGCPLREENYIHLSVRVERAYKINSWAENPPARTRRIIGNVQISATENNEYTVLSNFLLHYSRPGCSTYIYSGRRQDRLSSSGKGFSVLQRTVVMDYADINYPTMGLLF